MAYEMPFFGTDRNESRKASTREKSKLGIFNEGYMPHCGAKANEEALDGCISSAILKMILIFIFFMNKLPMSK